MQESRQQNATAETDQEAKAGISPHVGKTALSGLVRGLLMPGMAPIGPSLRDANLVFTPICTTLGALQQLIKHGRAGLSPLPLQDSHPGESHRSVVEGTAHHGVDHPLATVFPNRSWVSAYRDLSAAA